MVCVGIYDVLKNYEDNACEMTYMFEMPEYMVRLENQPDRIWKRSFLPNS